MQFPFIVITTNAQIAHILPDIVNCAHRYMLTIIFVGGVVFVVLFYEPAMTTTKLPLVG